MLKLAAALVPGFKIEGFWEAMMGSLFIGILNLAVSALFEL